MDRIIIIFLFASFSQQRGRLSHESEWQQFSSGFQDLYKYSGSSQEWSSLDGFDSPSDF